MADVAHRKKSSVDATKAKEAVKPAESSNSDAQKKEKTKKNKPTQEPKQKQQQGKKKDDSAALIGITTKKLDDLSTWYQEVLLKGDFLEYSDIPGCYIINVRTTCCYSVVLVNVY